MLTPSRMIFFSEEMMMSNRAIRHQSNRYRPSDFVRVIFREEDSRQVFPSNVPYRLIDFFIGNKLRNGFKMDSKIRNIF